MDKNKHIVGIGYRGMPTGCDDSAMPWESDGSDPLQDKELYGEHEFFIFMRRNLFITVLIPLN